jgi:DNA-binding CsgD family transcriptional regulator
MGHLIIYFYFIVFTIGFSLIFLGLFIWITNRQDKLKYFILTALSITLILFEQAVTAYDTVNGIEKNQLNMLLRYISTLGCVLMIYAITKLVMKLLDVENTKRRSKILGLYSILPFLGVTVYYITSNVLFLRIASAIYFASILINALFLFVNIDKIDNIVIKSAIRKLIVISLLMLPILIVDTIMEKLPRIGEEFPLGILSVMIYYVIICSLSIYYITRNYHEIIGALSGNAIPVYDKGIDKSDNMVSKFDYDHDLKVLDDFKITNREKEIIVLLIQANSYKEISEKLVITMPTVKTHIFNIYKKLGIKNKIELINILTLKR